LHHPLFPVQYVILFIYDTCSWNCFLCVQSSFHFCGIFRISNHSKLVSNCLERSGLSDSICIDWYFLKNFFSRHWSFLPTSFCRFWSVLFQPY
jgi:hypothetical protein